MEVVSEDDILLNHREVQQFLRASRSKVHRLIASGELVGHKVGRTWLFYKKDLKLLLEKHRSQPMEAEL